MKYKVLVTGGAGFIGSYISDELIRLGHDVVVFDNLSLTKSKPSYLNPNAEFVVGDVRDNDKVVELIRDVDIIFHEAALVSLSQSMKLVQDYLSVNTLGTGVLLNALINEDHSVKKLIVPSSVAVYGNGVYKCGDCGMVKPNQRREDNMKKGDWEYSCPSCNSNVKFMPLKEEHASIELPSVYSYTKQHQEQLSILLGKAYGIPTVALRYFNVFGPRQNPSNPYSGVCSLFVNQVLNGKSPKIFEDGFQTRDFIHVSDVAKANVLVMNDSRANYEIFNVSGGVPRTILDVADIIIRECGKKVKPNITNEYRIGDVRYSQGDISKISHLGFKPGINFNEGLRGLIDWVKGQC